MRISKLSLRSARTATAGAVGAGALTSAMLFGGLFGAAAEAQAAPAPAHETTFATVGGHGDPGLPVRGGHGGGGHGGWGHGGGGHGGFGRGGGWGHGGGWGRGGWGHGGWGHGGFGRGGFGGPGLWGRPWWDRWW